MADNTTRGYPKPRALLKYVQDYGEFHAAHPKKLSGKLSDEQIECIAELVRVVHPARILDYGSGKGYQYLKARIHERWGGLLPYCYDPGVVQLRLRPVGKFSGIICTDVMEHIDPTDVADVLQDIFNHIESGPAFAYFNICCRPAGKSFPDGRNLHLTVQPPEWWAEQLLPHERPGLRIKATYELGTDDDSDGDDLQC